MQYEDLFLSEAEMAGYVLERELPEWSAADLTGKPVQAPFPACLQVLRGAFRFRAYDDENHVVFERDFDTDNQQTLLKPNIRHSATALDENGRFLLQIYGEKP